jgi:nitrilase
MNSSVGLAVVQAGSVLFDLESTVLKFGELLSAAAAPGVDLVLFPEAFVSGYPRGQSFGAVVGSRSEEGRVAWERVWNSSISAPGPWTERMGKYVAQAGVYTAVGVIEQDSLTGGTLYCTTLYFGRDGALVGKHRKLKPTGSERLIWGEGDGSTLTVLDTSIGRIGGLICWENYMPLARMAMYRQGVQIYLAPTADSRLTWQSTLQHIACEGRCFVLGCNQYVGKESLDPSLFQPDEYAALPETVCAGGSVIVDPRGETLAGPLWGEEGVLTAEIDLGATLRGKYDFDAAGHYNRPDVFKYSVQDQPGPVRVP